MLQKHPIFGSLFLVIFMFSIARCFEEAAKPAPENPPDPVKHAPGGMVALINSL